MLRPHYIWPHSCDRFHTCERTVLDFCCCDRFRTCDASKRMPSPRHNSQMVRRRNQMEYRNTKLERRRMERRRSQMGRRRIQLERRRSQMERRRSQMERRRTQLERRRAKMDPKGSHKWAKISINQINQPDRERSRKVRNRIGKDEKKGSKVLTEMGDIWVKIPEKCD
jgi:exonuclease VII large subunit